MEKHIEPCLFTREKVCKELAYIFEANVDYIERLFKFKRISLENNAHILTTLFSKPKVKFTDIFDRSQLCYCARAIFFLYEDDTKLHDMYALFTSHIHEKYDGDVDAYGEGIRKRCAQSYKIMDIIDYMCDDLSDLQTELDGDAEESEDENKP